MQEEGSAPELGWHKSLELRLQSLSGALLCPQIHNPASVHEVLGLFTTAKAFLDPGKSQEVAKPGIPGASLQLGPTLEFPPPCPAPLTEGRCELPSWMPTVPLDIIPNPRLALFV